MEVVPNKNIEQDEELKEYRKMYMKLVFANMINDFHKEAVKSQLKEEHKSYKMPKRYVG